MVLAAVCLLNEFSFFPRRYLSNQVLPPIARLCGPIEDTDPARIAHHLGLTRLSCLVLPCLALLIHCLLA